jgi:hypothetical protein
MRLRLLPLAILLALLPGCGGTWVDDDRNFSRVFGFSKLQDVSVIHSYYWKSSHWSVEYRYFIALQASPKFASGLTSTENMTAVRPDKALVDACGGNPPEWFLPKPLTSYEAWLPKATGYRVFRDKEEGTLFVCEERL